MEVLGVDPLERLIALRGRGDDVRGADDQRHRHRCGHRRWLLLHRHRPGRLGRRVPVVVHRAREPALTSTSRWSRRWSSAGSPRSSAPTRAQRRRRPERGRTGRQRVGDRRVHAAVLPQRGDHGDLLPGRPAPGALRQQMASIGAMGTAFVGGGATPLESVRRPAAVLRQGTVLDPAGDRALPARGRQHPGGGHLRRGRLSMIAGTVGVIAFLAFFAGTEVGIQGYASLSQIGVAKFSVHLRLLQHPRGGPWCPPIALAATVGCGYTARLGAMRISRRSTPSR